MEGEKQQNHMPYHLDEVDNMGMLNVECGEQQCCEVFLFNDLMPDDACSSMS